MAEGQADRRVMWTLAVQMDPAARETIDQFIAQLERIPRGAGTVAIGTAAAGGYATTPQQAYTGPAQGPTIAAQGGGGVVAGAGYSSPPPAGSTLSPSPRAHVADTPHASGSGRVVRDPRTGLWYDASGSSNRAYASEAEARQAAGLGTYTIPSRVGGLGGPSEPSRVLDISGGSPAEFNTGVYRTAWLSHQRRMEGGNRSALAGAQRFPQRYQGGTPEEREIARTQELEDRGLIDTTEASRRYSAIREAAQRRQGVAESRGQAKAQGVEATRDYRQQVAESRGIARSYAQEATEAYNAEQDERRQAERYEDRVVRERDIASRRAQQRSERQARFGETPQGRRDREIAESRHQYDLGNITAQQHLAARGGIQRQYDTRQAQERNRLENEYFRTQQRIEAAQASIHRQMSYASMAAMEVGRGFGYIGAMAGKSTEQILKALAAVEALFAIGRGVTLARSAFENISKQRALLEHVSMREAGVGASGMVRAEGLGTMARTVGGLTMAEAAPAAAGAGWLAGGGGLPRLLGGTAAGIGAVGAGAGAAFALPFAIGSWLDKVAPTPLGQPMPATYTGGTNTFTGIEGIRTAQRWERTARAYGTARRLAEERTPWRTTEQGIYERGLEPERMRAGAETFERGIGGLPSPWRLERPVEQARLAVAAREGEQAKAAWQLGEARTAWGDIEKRDKEYRNQQDKMAELDRRRLEPRWGAGPGGMGGFQPGLTVQEDQQLLRIQRGEGTFRGVDPGERERIRENLIAAEKMAAEKEGQTNQARIKLREAQVKYAESLVTSAKEQFDSIQARSSAATRSIMERRASIGAMNEGERSQLRVAIASVQAGADPRVIPENFKQMIRSGLGGYDLQQRLKRQEIDLGAQFAGQTGIETGDMRRKRLADEALDKAAGRFVPPGEEKPATPAPGGIAEQRMKLAEADMALLKEGVDAEKKMADMLVAISRVIAKLDKLDIGRLQGENAANKQTGRADVPAGGVPLNVRPQLQGQ